MGFARVIGGIDWGYTNPTAAVVFGLDGDDRGWQLAELYLPRASLHETVIPALVEMTEKWGVGVWYAGPDEPEHIAGLRLALERAGNGRSPNAPTPQVVAADDAVVAGIQTVTRQLARRADGTRGLYVDPSCRWTIAEYASYQYPPTELAAMRGGDDDGSPSPAHGGGGWGEGSALSELPLKANDHLMDACFPAGTAIETIAGPKPIEWIRAGDYVQTRTGYRRVRRAGMTNPCAEVWRVALSNGTEILGTRHHPIYVQGKGFVALQALSAGDTLLMLSDVARKERRCINRGNPIVPRRLSTEESSSDAIPNRFAGRIGCITLHQARIGIKAWIASIRKYGKMPTGLFRRAIISTTATATRSTTRWTTLPVSQGVNTTSITCPYSALLSAPGAGRGSTTSGRPPRTGIAPRLVGNGITSLGSYPGTVAGTPPIAVTTAARSSSRAPMIPMPSSSAPAHVSPQLVAPLERTRKNASASSAERGIRPTATPAPRPAPVHVESVTATGSDGKPISCQAVYNLEVEQAHEYFAQGVLVHNCRYALHTHFAQVRDAQRTDGWLARWMKVKETRPWRVPAPLLMPPA